MSYFQCPAADPSYSCGFVRVISSRTFANSSCRFRPRRGCPRHLPRYLRSCWSASPRGRGRDEGGDLAVPGAADADAQPDALNGSAHAPDFSAGVINDEQCISHRLPIDFRGSFTGDESSEKVFYAPRSFGSSLSRMASPSRFDAKTTRLMALPG